MANNRRRLQGRVISNKMDKTVVVEIEQRSMHRLYKKVISSSKRLMAHDESDEIPLGAIVRVVESRPLSKRKRWAVEEVLETPDVVMGNIISDADVQSVISDDQPPEETEEA
jgi:small subunit ribosomal protein S17